MGAYRTVIITQLEQITDIKPVLTIYFIKAVIFLSDLSNYHAYDGYFAWLYGLYARYEACSALGQMVAKACRDPDIGRHSDTEREVQHPL